MHLTVIIPTLGRDDLVGRTIDTLREQSRQPDETLVSAPYDCKLAEQNSYVSNARFVYGPAGLTRQRNRAISEVCGSADIIVFFDDDFLACHDYLQRVEQAFAENPSWAAVTGRVFKDGVSNAGLTFDEGLSALAAAERASRSESVCDCVAAYGCNMSIRANLIGDLRFDERLPLYGWQEDVDFTTQIRRRGRVMRLESLIGVHLGHKAGRVSGVRFGYSQIANPIYLMRKGTMPWRRGVSLMARNIAANSVKSIKPEAFIDRRGRLRGNAIGLMHHLQGRLDPEAILKL